MYVVEKKRGGITLRFRCTQLTVNVQFSPRACLNSFFVGPKPRSSRSPPPAAARAALSARSLSLLSLSLSRLLARLSSASFSAYSAAAFSLSSGVAPTGASLLAEDGVALDDVALDADVVEAAFVAAAAAASEAASSSERVCFGGRPRGLAEPVEGRERFFFESGGPKGSPGCGVACVESIARSERAFCYNHKYAASNGVNSRHYSRFRHVVVQNAM